MNERLMVIFCAVVVLIGINACMTTRMASSPLDEELKKLNVPAVIAITPEDKLVVLTLEGKELEPCSIPKEGEPIPENVCPAFKKGAEVLFKENITVIKSKGSCCYTYYDSSHNAHTICIPGCQ